MRSLSRTFDAGNPTGTSKKSIKSVKSFYFMSKLNCYLACHFDFF